MIRNAWHFYYAVVLVVKVVCGSFGISNSIYRLIYCYWLQSNMS
ncbi:DUF3265 domain-containing protein [Vibrio alginolyticus]|nr:DUF3265 domain-containing protein [Vibrio alginolyticus]